MSERPCIVCERKLGDADVQTCMRCVARVRSQLVEIETLYAVLPQAIIDRAGAGRFAPGGSRSAEPPPLGGDAMVLYGPGSDGANQVRDIITGRNEYGAHAAEEFPGDARSVLGELERWERDWRHTMGLPAATDEATVSSCGLFLQRHLAAMAQRHEAFDEFAEDIRVLVGQLRTATSEGDPIDRGKRIECEECGEPLIRRYRKARPCEHPGLHCDHSDPDSRRWPCRGSNTCACDQGGRTDHWICSSRSCGAEVDNTSYWLRVKQRYEARRACENREREAC